MAQRQLPSYEARALDTADFTFVEERLGEAHWLTGDRLLRASWISIAVIAIVIFGWGGLAPLHKGVSATGAISTQSARQVINHLDGGIISKILVKEGQKVKAGDTLVELDPVQATTEYQVLRQQYFDRLAERAMLEADLTGKPIQWPAEVTAAQGEPMVKTIMEAEQKLLEDRRSSRSTQKAVLGRQIASLGDQVNGLNSQVSSIRSQSDLIADETKGVQGLYDRGYAPKTRLLALQRNAASLDGSLGEAQAQISQAHTTMGEKQVQSLQIDAQAHEESAKRLADVQTEILQLSQKMQNQNQVLKRTVIKSPMDGVVLERHVATVGGVVRPGEPILDMTPIGDIEVTARVRPQEVESVHIGQGATIRFTGLNVQTTPRLLGKITYVSPDALSDQKTGQRYYEIRASVPGDERKKLKDVELTPGMPADVLVDGGSRTALAYLLQPVANAFSHAFREG